MGSQRIYLSLGLVIFLYNAFVDAQGFIPTQTGGSAFQMVQGGMNDMNSMRPHYQQVQKEREERERQEAAKKKNWYGYGYGYRRDSRGFGTLNGYGEAAGKIGATDYGENDQLQRAEGYGRSSGLADGFQGYGGRVNAGLYGGLGGQAYSGRHRRFGGFANDDGYRERIGRADAGGDGGIGGRSIQGRFGGFGGLGNTGEYQGEMGPANLGGFGGTGGGYQGQNWQDNTGAYGGPEGVANVAGYGGPWLKYGW